MSFGAKFFGGYRRDKVGVRNYENEARQNLLAQQKNLAGINFICGEYHSFTIPEKSLIYCDPPYRGTTQYRDKFDHNSFYEWCDKKAHDGHTIFLSEYSAPTQFDCVFEKQVSSNLDVSSKGKKRDGKNYLCINHENL